MKPTDWVEWNAKNHAGTFTPRQGIVKSMTNTGEAVVHYNFDDDRYLQVKAPIKLFVRIQKPALDPVPVIRIPKPVSAKKPMVDSRDQGPGFLDSGTYFLSKWSVRLHTSIKVTGGMMFTCTISRNGENAIAASNDGVGCMNSYDPISGCSSDYVNEFTAAANALWNKFSKRNEKHAHMDAVLDWMINLSRHPVCIQDVVDASDAKLNDLD